MDHPTTMIHFRILDIPPTNQHTQKHPQYTHGASLQTSHTKLPNTGQHKVEHDHVNKHGVEDNMDEDLISVCDITGDCMTADDGLCLICGVADGVVAVCAKPWCGRFYHLDCIALTEWPKKNWFCGVCYRYVLSIAYTNSWITSLYGQF